MKYSLVGVNGNAYAVMGYVKKAMKEVGNPKEEIDGYFRKAVSGDYNNLIAVSTDILEKLNQEMED